MATYESIRYSFGGSLVTALQSPNMADGTVTNTEFQFINTLTSNAQTQINTKFGAAGGTFTSDVTLADNVDLNFGNGNDMIITSNGTASFIKGNAITIEDTSGNDMATFVANGAAKLFFGGSQKLESTNTGVTVAGTMAAGALQGDGTNITALAAANIATGGTLPSLVGTALTSLNAANLTGTYAALNGGSITSLNATNVASGTLANARLPSSISVTNVSGNGSGLTNLNASNLSSGTVPTARLPGGLGKVLQVVSTNNGTVFSTSSSSYVDVVGQAVTITPSATSSKVLVTLDYTTDTFNDNTVYSVQLVRGSTAIGNAANGNQMIHMNANEYDTGGFTFLDSPSTTSATTYKLQVKAANGGTIIFNRSQDSSNLWKSNITVQEIGA